MKPAVFSKCVHELSFSRSSLDRVAFADAPAPVLTHACEECRLSFSSSRALRMHRAKKHNLRSHFKFYADSNGICPVCHACLCSMLMLLSHLSDTRRIKCSSQLSCFPRLSQERVDELDDLDRVAKRLSARSGHSHVLAVGQATSASGRCLGRASC